MSNPTEGQPVIRVTIHWDRQSGTFDSNVFGADPAEVAVVVMDDEGIVYGNNAADPDPEDEDEDDLSEDESETDHGHGG